MGGVTAGIPRTSHTKRAMETRPCNRAAADFRVRMSWNGSDALRSGHRLRRNRTQRNIFTLRVLAEATGLRPCRLRHLLWHRNSLRRAPLRRGAPGVTRHDLRKSEAHQEEEARPQSASSSWTVLDAPGRTGTKHTFLASLPAIGARPK